MELTFGLPDDALVLSWTAPERLRIDDDVCVIDAERYFLRAVLPLPVAGRVHPYRIGLWVEIDRAALVRVAELWTDPQQASEPPFRVHVANDVPTAEGIKGAAASLYLTGPTTRPSVHLSQTGTRLHDEQAHGITPHRASEYTRMMMADDAGLDEASDVPPG
jgi:hypothetical protein